MVNITVLIITFNQQDVIGRALDSVLQQKEWGLKEIVVCDDHSTDNNWAVILSYKEKYPEYIRSYRNDHNLGIYGNVEKTYILRGNADLYVNLSGDDTFCSGYFECAQKFIENKKIDVNNESAIICFDYQCIYPDGSISIFRNNRIKANVNSARLKLRGLVCSRGMLMTEKVMSQYQNVPLNKGVTLAENMCEIQGFTHSNVAYYCPFVGSVYYGKIGISISMQSVTGYEQRIVAWDSLSKLEWLSKKDISYCLSRKHLNAFLVKPNVASLFNAIKYFIKNIDHSVGNSYILLLIDIRSIVYRLLPRINMIVKHQDPKHK